MSEESVTPRPPSEPSGKIRPRPPSQPRDAPPPNRTFDRVRPSGSAASSTATRSSTASPAPVEATPSFTVAPAADMGAVPRLPTSKRSALVQPRGASAGLSSSLTNPLSSRPLLRPCSARQPARSPMAATDTGTRVAFRHLFASAGDDAIAETVARDTAAVQASLDLVHQVLDAQALSAPGAPAAPPSALLTRLFFTDRSGDQQLVYRLASVGKAGALERLLTVMGQTEAALLRLTEPRDAADRPDAPGVSADLAAALCLIPDPAAAGAPPALPEAPRAALFEALVARVLHMHQQLASRPQADAQAAGPPDSTVDADTLSSLAHKLSAAEDSLRDLAADLQFAPLPPPPALRSLLQADPHSARAALCRAAHVAAAAEHSREWVDKMREYEGEEQRGVVRELGETVRQLRAELFEARAGAEAAATQRAAGGSSSEESSSSLAARVQAQEDEIARLQALLRLDKAAAAEAPAGDASPAADETVADETVAALRTQLEQRAAAAERAEAEVRRLQALLAAADDKHRQEQDAAQRQLLARATTAEARAAQSADAEALLSARVSELELRSERAEAELEAVERDAALAQDRVLALETAAAAGVAEAAGKVEAAVAAYCGKTGAEVSTASEDSVAMLLCVCKNKLDKLRQATLALDAASREAALRREHGAARWRADAKTAEAAAEAAEAALDRERATFTREATAMRDELAVLGGRVARLRAGPSVGASRGLVDSPLDECEDDVARVFRREMEALRRAMVRQTAALRDAAHRKELSVSRELANTQRTLAELQRTHAQTASKLAALQNK